MSCVPVTRCGRILVGEQITTPHMFRTATVLSAIWSPLLSKSRAKKVLRSSLSQRLCQIFCKKYQTSVVQVRMGLIVDAPILKFSKRDIVTTLYSNTISRRLQTATDMRWFIESKIFEPEKASSCRAEIHYIHIRDWKL